jgi:hypothetical protein
MRGVHGGDTPLLKGVIHHERTALEPRRSGSRMERPPRRLDHDPPGGARGSPKRSTVIGHPALLARNTEKKSGSPMKTRSRACGSPLPPYRGRGRPRIRCEACAADRSALGRAWRAAHPEAVEAYNARRREEYAEALSRAWESERPSILDGRLMTQEPPAARRSDSPMNRCLSGPIPAN